MALRFLCFNCSAKIKVPDGTQGRKVKCPSCGSLQRVPDPQAPQAAPAHIEPTPEPPAAPTPQASVPVASPAPKAPQPVAQDNTANAEQAAKSSRQGKRSKKVSSGYASSMPPAAPIEQPTPAAEPEPDLQLQEPPADDADDFETDDNAFDPLSALAAAAGNEPAEDDDDTGDEDDTDDTDDTDFESSESPSYELADDGLDDQPPQPQVEEVVQAPVPLEIKDDEPEPVSLKEQDDEPVEAPAAEPLSIAPEASDEEPEDEEPEDEESEDDASDESIDEDSDDELAQAMAAAAQAASADDDALDFNESPAPGSEPDALDEPQSIAGKLPEDESPALPWTDVSAAADRQDHEAKERAVADSAVSHMPESDDASETDEAPVQAKPAAAPATPKAIPLGHASTFRSTMASPQPVPGVASQNPAEKQAVNQGLPQAKVHHTASVSDVNNDDNDNAAGNASDGYDDSPSPGGFDDNAADTGMTQNDLAAQAFAVESAQEASLAKAAAAGVIPVAAAAAAGVAASTPAYGRSTSAASSSASAVPSSAAHRPRGLYRSLQVAATLLRVVAVMLLMLAVVQCISWQRGSLPEVLGASGYKLVYALQVFIPLGLAAVTWGVAECCAAARELLRR